MFKYEDNPEKEITGGDKQSENLDSTKESDAKKQK
jgi:hypothetical protein